MAKPKSSTGLTARFYSNKRTPVIDKVGAKPKKKSNYGSLIKTRAVTADEKKQMSGGKWLRKDVKGRTPGDPGYLNQKSLGPSAAASAKAVANRKRKKKS
jgi:hypothetical protein